MGGILSTMDIAKQALHLSQTQLEVTGNNISNVDTPGYSRRKALVEENHPLNTVPGQIGMGVKAPEIIRIFDEFIERQYIGKVSEKEKWETLAANFSSLESIFNENQEGRLNDALAQFFKDWQDLSLEPDNANIRSVLMSNTRTLIETLSVISDDLETLAAWTDDVIADEVEETNALLEEIADLNKQIKISERPGVNANAYLDERDLKIRELAKKLDISCVDNGNGNLSITTKGGYTLVDGVSHFALDFRAPQATSLLRPDSTFTDGQVYFHGSSSYEYTLEVTTGGGVDGTPPAQYKVSIDGGRTWLTDDDGNVRTFDATSRENRISLPGGELEVYFGQKNDAGTVPATNLVAGDAFVLVPKKGVYWDAGENMSANITSQSYGNDQYNTARLVGGTLGGNLAFRDEFVGEYRERLGALVKGLVWEINSIHSQGSGLKTFTNVTGTYDVINTDEGLGTPRSGLAFSERLQSGNLSLTIYDKDGNKVETTVLDFDDTTAGTQNFDPATHSLEDVRDAFNAVDGITATIEDGKLTLTATTGTGYSFAFGSDSSGLLAGLGINTYLEGEDASSLGINGMVAHDLELLNAGQLDASGFMDPGNNEVAQDIAALQYTELSFSTFANKTGKQTIQDFYSALVSTIGADTSRSKFNLNYQTSLTNDLEKRQDAVAGVNLDEEMANLIRFQQSYAAAAKLITTANQMFDTLLGIKN